MQGSDEGSGRVQPSAAEGGGGGGGGRIRAALLENTTDS